MPHAWTLVIACSLLLAGVAGCVTQTSTGPGENEPTVTETSLTCHPVTEDLAAHVTVGEPVTFTVHPRCPAGLSVVEQGAAFTAGAQLPASPDGFEGGCPVSENEVTCTFEAAGSYLLVAQVSTGNDTERQLHASQAYRVVAEAPDDLPPLAGASTVQIMDLPASPEAGEPVTFRVVIGWAITPPGVDTDRIGVRYDGEHHANASLIAYDAACPYVAGIVPGDGDGYSVTCTWATPGPVFLRGFAQTPSGPGWLEHWGREVTLTVR